jgi:hypothetical protein
MISMDDAPAGPKKTELDEKDPSERMIQIVFR